jgi:ectoine hydroxylase
MATKPDPYLSRSGNTPRLLGRLDPVVYSKCEITEQAPLTNEQTTFYEENGYLHLEELFSKGELEKFQAELEQLRQEAEKEKTPEVVLEPDGNAIRSIFAIHKSNTLVGRLSRDHRLVDIVSFLLGSQVYIHQSRINYKPGFEGQQFYWHSDFETWHAEDGMPRMRALSASIALTDNYAFNGPLMLIPGSHKTFVPCVGDTPEDHYRQSLKKQEYGVPDRASLKRLADQGGIVAPTGPAGSVVFFDCNTMHGSNSNISPFARSNVFFVYNSVENALTQPFCGLKPRPEHIAARESSSVLQPLSRK